MIFWDTSAVVPLLLEEAGSRSAKKLAQRDPALAVFWTTSVECRSAIARRVREGTLPHGSADVAHVRLEALAAAWSEIQPTQEVRLHAERLLLRHPLRAADALQLGAALVWAMDRPRKHRFATFDARLNTAARAEGFLIIDP